MKKFLSWYFEQETFKLWAKLLRELSQFFIFRVQMACWHVFLKDTRFFWGSKLKSSAFGRKNFNKVFKSAFKMWNRTFVFFLVTQVFFSALEHFFSKIGQKKSYGKIRVQNNVLVIFPKQFFFQFCTLSGKLPHFEENFSEKPSIFHFSCAEDIWYFLSQRMFSYRTVRTILLASTKNVSAVFLKVHSDCAEERSSCFFLEKRINLLGPKTNFSRNLK